MNSDPSKVSYQCQKVSKEVNRYDMINGKMPSLIWYYSFRFLFDYEYMCVICENAYQCIFHSFVGNDFNFSEDV